MSENIHKSGAVDVALLQAEKQLIRQKLLNVETKQRKLSDVLGKKIQKIDGRDPYKSTTVQGMPLEEFRATRIAKTAATALPPVQKKSAPQPIPVTESSKIGKLRTTIIQRRLTALEAAASNSNSKESLASVEIKPKSKNDTSPVKKIPASLFPNRYRRGELPCSIEHGATGIVAVACPDDKLEN